MRDDDWAQALLATAAALESADEADGQANGPVGSGVPAPRAAFQAVVA